MADARPAGPGSTIWIQSCSAESDAGIWGGYQESVRRHARRVVRKDFAVEFHGVSRTYPGIDFVDSAIQLAANEVVRNAILAEEAGYAAFAFISTNDAGNREVRELTDIPAAYIVESSVQLAAQLGGKFAFLTHNAGSRRKMEQLTVERIGLGAMLVEGASINLTYNDFAGMYKDPAPFLAQFEQAARPAIARGARVLIPAGGPLNMFFVDQGLRQVDGVPLIDIHGAVFKDAERMADLAALGAPRRAAPSVSAEQRKQLRVLFLAAK
jgi:Asp/Glu/hydantoin racemase